MRNYLYRDQTKLNINADNFINCKSKYHAYLLGFMWADGHLIYKYKKKEMRIEITEEDINSIKNIFEVTGNWCFSTRYRSNRKPQTTAIANNAKLGDFLYENDYKTKTMSTPTKIINKIPIEFRQYFMRGWSDGDGSFYKNKTSKQYSICGSFDQDWKVLEDIFTKNEIKYKIQRRTHKTGKFSVIRVWNNKSLQNIHSLLYGNGDFDEIGLKRKYDKSKDIISQLKT